MGKYVAQAFAGMSETQQYRIALIWLCEELIRIVNEAEGARLTTSDALAQLATLKEHPLHLSLTQEGQDKNIKMIEMAELLVQKVEPR